MKNGKPSYVHNWVGKQRYTITASQRVPSGKATIRYKFAYDGGDSGSGGTGTIFINDEKVAEGRIDKTTPFIFSADETADVGVVRPGSTQPSAGRPPRRGGRRP